MKTKLPVAETVLMRKKIDDEEVKAKIQQKRRTQKEYYDRGTKELQPFVVGDKVLFKKNEREWKYGKVDKIISDRSYIVIDKNKNVYRRNRVMMRKQKMRTRICQ